MTPPTGVASEGTMSRIPAAAGESPRTAWKYSGIMNMYWDRQSAVLCSIDARGRAGDRDTYCVCRHAREHIGQLNNHGLPSV